MKKGTLCEVTPLNKELGETIKCQGRRELASTRDEHAHAVCPTRVAQVWNHILTKTKTDSDTCSYISVHTPTYMYMYVRKITKGKKAAWDGVKGGKEGEK